MYKKKIRNEDANDINYYQKNDIKGKEIKK